MVSVGKAPPDRLQDRLEPIDVKEPPASSFPANLRATARQLGLE